MKQPGARVTFMGRKTFTSENHLNLIYPCVHSCPHHSLATDDREIMTGHDRDRRGWTSDTDNVTM